MSTADRRHPEIDALKALGIVTVVLIHCVRDRLDGSAPALELQIGYWTRFGVPSFLAASGFLYATAESRTLEALRRRLVRILIPYLVASLLAHAWFAAVGVHGPRSFWFALLLGSTFGAYYYVFVVIGLVLATPVIARLSGRALVGLACLALLAQAAIESGWIFRLSFFWTLRNPLLWWAYFLVGWLASLHAARLRGLASRHRLVLSMALLGLLWGLAVPLGLEHALPRWLSVYTILALIFVVASGKRAMPTLIRRLADATYGIYLFHLFFVYTLMRMLPRRTSYEADLWQVGLLWLAGLAGSLAFLALARRLLGERSRVWLGA